MIDTALAKDPGDRWATCGEMAAAAEAALGMRAAATGPRRRRRIRRRAVAVFGGAAVLALAALALVLSQGDGEDTATPALTAGQVIAFDAVTGREQGRPRRREGTPTALTAADGKLWMVDAETRTLLRLDPKTGDSTPRPPARPRSTSSTGPAGIWVTNGSTPKSAEVPPRSVRSPRRSFRSILGTQQRTPQWRCRARISGRRDGRQPARPVVGRAVGDHRRGRGRPDRSGDRDDTRPKGRLRAWTIAAGGLGVWVLAQDDVDGFAAQLDERTGRSSAVSSSMPRLRSPSATTQRG